MVEITRDEAMFLRDKGIYCPRTCKLKRKGKSRSKFYAPDDVRTIGLLESYRNTIQVVCTYGNVE